MNILLGAGAVLLGLAWLVPNHYPPWNSFYNDACAGWALVVLAIAAGRKALKCRAPWIVWFVALVALVPVAQSTLGLVVFSGDAIVSCLYIFGLAGAILVGYTLAEPDDERLPTLLASAAVVAGAISTFLVLNQVLGIGGLGIWLQDIQPGFRPYANLGQNNNLGTLFGLASVGLLYLYERRGLGGGIGAVLLGLLLVGATIPQSRTSLLFGPVIVSAVWVARRRGMSFRVSNSTLLVAAAAYVVLFSIWPHLRSELLLSGEPTLLARGGQTPRLRMWPLLLDALSRSPWVGYGWLQVANAEQAVVADHGRVGEMWTQAHDLPLELMLWCGIPLGIALAAAILYWVVSRAARLRTVTAFIGFLVLLLVMVHSLLEFPYHYAYFLIPVGLWIGVVERATSPPGPFSARLNLPFQFVALLLFIAVTRDYLTVEGDFRLARFEAANIGFASARQARPDAPLLSQLTHYSEFMRRRHDAPITEQELADATLVVHRFPFALSLEKLAEMQASAGRLDQAVSTYEKISLMYDPRLYAALRRQLHERAADGTPGSKALDRALPR